ncbi:hypothetical protein D3C71_1441030 [compost metagenome]
MPNQIAATSPRNKDGIWVPYTPNGARRYTANDRPCSVPMSAVRVISSASTKLASKMTATTCSSGKPDTPVAPNWKVAIMKAMPIQIQVKPSVPIDRCCRLIGRIEGSSKW